MKLLYIVGARPNYMKVAPLMRETSRRGNRFTQSLVHTGQHYDTNMSDIFFQQLGMPEPNHYLAVGSGSHAYQTGNIILSLEPVMISERPDVVIVVGDTNSTLAGALVASKLRIPVAHVEAGLRSRDRTMPEETNRIIVDVISDYLFTPSPDANENLRAEGLPEEKIHFVGNVMIDSLVQSLDLAKSSPIHASLGISKDNYVLMTLHRPANVDNLKSLQGLLEVARSLAESMPIVFPLHPRTMAKIRSDSLEHLLEKVITTEPLGYLDFLALTRDARVVLTDSGGIQEETTFLGTPCLTLRENTERPSTVTHGTNKVVGVNPETILKEAMAALRSPRPPESMKPERWDGNASQRIIDVFSGAI